MKKLNWLSRLLICSLFISLCSCSFRVTAPLPSDTTAAVNGFSMDPTGHLVIKVTFSDPVDRSTVITQKTLILKFAKNANESATLLWSADNKTLTITTVDRRDDIMTFSPDGGFSLTLIGVDTGNGVVKSTKGAILDGDYSGKPGGNYVKGFTIIG
jgi:hypothetical protein